MEPCTVEAGSEDEFIVVENHRVLQLWTLTIRHIFRRHRVKQLWTLITGLIFRLRFKQRQFAFLGIHLRDNTSKPLREALKNLKFR
jgi:hypothetical protein